ncbi:MAG: hypothetical protein U0R19_17190 [Bryobacteraceae bacterium]
MLGEGFEGTVDVAAIAGFGAADVFEGVTLHLRALAMGVFVEDFVGRFGECRILGGIHGGLGPFEGFLMLHALNAPAGVGEVLVCWGREGVFWGSAGLLGGHRWTQMNTDKTVCAFMFAQLEWCESI